MTPREEVDELLKTHGCVLKRSKNHEVWDLPNGLVFTRAKTPGPSSDRNSLADLRIALGLSKRGQPAREGEKPERMVRVKNPAMQEAFAKVNLAPEPPTREQQLESEVKYLKSKIMAQRDHITGQDRNHIRTRNQVEFFREQWKACWWCQLKRSWRTFRSRMRREGESCD